MSVKPGQGRPIRPRLGFEPLTTLAVVAGITVLVRALRKLFADARYRGVMIDLTKNPVEMRDMPGWDRRQVLVVTTDGPQFHQFDQEDDLQELLANLLPGG